MAGPGRVRPNSASVDGRFGFLVLFLCSECKDLATALPDTFLNDGLMSLLSDGEPSVQHIQKISYRFMIMYREAEACGLLEPLPHSVAEALAIVAKSVKCMLVLADPRPGRCGTCPADVINVLNASGSDGPEMTLQLTLKENKFWQRQADDVVKTGAAATRLGPELLHCEAAVESMEELEFDKIDVEAFKRVQAFTGQAMTSLREGASETFQQDVLSLVRRLARELMDAELDGDMPVALIRAVREGLNLFVHAEGIAELRNEFKQWQSQCDHAISTSSLKAFLTEASGNLQDPAKVRDHITEHLSKTIFHPTNPVEMPAECLAELQKIAAALYKLFHQDAFNKPYNCRTIQRTISYYTLL